MGVKPDDLARMTDRQIDLLYAHPRDRNGRLIIDGDVPARAARRPGLAGDLAALAELRVQLGLSPEKVAELAAKLEAKHGGERGTDTP
jgi:hypothetical protein